MDETQYWIISIIAPAILLLVLVWLVMRTRSNRADPAGPETREGTRDVYAEEEQRRREGTDDL